MMIQTAIPGGLGLLFTPWTFTTPLLLAGVTTTAVASYLLVLLRTSGSLPSGSPPRCSTAPSPLASPPEG